LGLCLAFLLDMLAASLAMHVCDLANK